MGFQKRSNVGLTCNLEKLVYDIKQLPRVCIDGFIRVMIAIGYKLRNEHHVLIFKHSPSRGL